VCKRCRHWSDQVSGITPTRLIPLQHPVATFLYYHRHLGIEWAASSMVFLNAWCACYATWSVTFRDQAHPGCCVREADGRARCTSRSACLTEGQPFNQKNGQTCWPPGSNLAGLQSRKIGTAQPLCTASIPVGIPLDPDSQWYFNM
jgi:hypothetical protein